MTRPASLGMYDMPALHRANDALWSGIATRLRTAGLDDVPDRLDRTRPIGDIWRDPALLLAHTCGYPLVKVLDGIAEPVAVPVYGWPGCDGARHGSLLVVPAASPFEELVQLRGRRAAFNGHDSNTGMNLFRHAVAPLAEGEAFFAATIETGSHLASLDRVASGDADIAAIDCVTFGQAMRHDPQRTTGVRVIGRTASGPGLPFVTRRGTTAAEIAVLREAIADALADRDLAPPLRALGLLGIEPIEREAYRVLLDYEREAAALGYGTLR